MESFQKEYNEYLNNVFNQMEYIGVPDVVMYYKEEDVAKTFNEAIAAFFSFSVSYRTAALVIWALSMRKLMDDMKKDFIH